ncbi:GNAT family protein [Micromonospora sp. BRA006-A]|nr:GNAT family protein [Micromonospora sp. BRA006-A]
MGWGRGVAVRATRALARWAFDASLRRLTWQAEIGNHASGWSRYTPASGSRVSCDWPTPAPAAGPRAGSARCSPARSPPPATRSPTARTRPGPAAAVFGRPQPVLFATAGDTELRLRALEERDLAAVTRTCQDEQTIRWTTVPHPYRPEHAEGFLRDLVRPAWARARR